MPFVAQTNPDNFVQGDTLHFHLSLDFGILQTTVVVFRAMDRPLAAQSTEMLWKFLILILVEFGIRWGLVADEGSWRTKEVKNHRNFLMNMIQKLMSFSFQRGR